VEKHRQEHHQLTNIYYYLHFKQHFALLVNDISYSEKADDFEQLKVLERRMNQLEKVVTE
jgi:predicted AAA+ superfamily ATPase